MPGKHIPNFSLPEVCSPDSPLTNTPPPHTDHGVNGESVNLPVSLESGKVRVFRSGSAAVLETVFGLRVSYDWSHYAVVMVPSLYSGSLCGLCGNFNGEPADDFVSPNGTALPTAAVFGNSWKISHPEAVCSDDPGSVIRCSDSDRRLLSSESYCGVLSNVSGPFHRCHSVLSPMSSQENCIYDLCAVGVSEELRCQAIGSYAAECQRRGVMTGDWRNATGCGKDQSCLWELLAPAPNHGHSELVVTAFGRFHGDMGGGGHSARHQGGSSGLI
ncbi:alpha-tectorin-like [Hemiscyllium ocellatum]|uniref:alpha-tectorin-like n=1 Tax=Hemiscyllium ocellatum TaxID=170820 RepID=UPI002966FFBB|nr:alpha-tectorin-like [Hemiscyllium ocellatum]XP_060678201.1 alpha-tectorin-like [Hemiscyllium ocellatum]